MLSKKLRVIITVGILFCLSCAAYTEGSPGVGSQSQVITVSQSSDDAEEYVSTGRMYLGSSDLEMVEESGTQIVGVRFQRVNIPAGSTISNAYIQFTTDEADSRMTSLIIRGHDIGDAPTFNASDRNISSREVTSASVSWPSIPAWNVVGESGPKQRTPDLSSIVQEIVNRRDWFAGNSMVFIISGTGKRVANSYNKLGGTPPKLYLEWTTFDYMIEFVQATSSGPEDGSTVDVEVQLTGGNPGTTVMVDYLVTDISTGSGDYSPYPAFGTLTFSGNTSALISFILEPDSLVEGDEQFSVTLFNVNSRGVNVGLGAIMEHIVTIIDNSPTVQFSMAGSSVEESDITVNLEVVLNKPWPDPVTVDYAVNVVASTAQSPADYTMQGSGTLTFDGVTSQFIPVTIVDDDYEEPAETIVVTLSNPSSNASLGAKSGYLLVISASDISLNWPMWRYDSNRSGATPVDLPPNLYRQWELRLPRLQQAWPDQGSRIDYDRCYQPIVLGQKLFVGSSATDSVTAYDTETCAVIWRFFADAPIRFAPVGWIDNPADINDDKLFVVSDDGYLYCLNANNGSVVWKFRGAPSGRKGIGNKRLGSLWPARGGPTLLNGTLYFAAGIWPFMGSFIYALDAATGEVIWINDGSGSIYMDQPHGGSVSFGALAPQGYLVAIGDRLVVPNGRAVAAGLNRHTGELLYFHFQANNKNSTNHVAAFGDYFNNSGRLFRLSDGSTVGTLADGAIMTESGNYTNAFCKAGDRLYKGTTNSISATTLSGSLIWRKKIKGTPASMLAGDGKLFVVTEEGSIYCYGPMGLSNPPVINEVADVIAWPAEDEWTTKAQEILTATGVDGGYCLVLGVGSGRLMEELARQAELNQYDLHVIGLDPNAAKIDALRNRWYDMGILNEQLSAIVGEICTAQLPPYLAHLIVSEDLDAAGIDKANTFVEKAFYSLRPYGGQICLDSEALQLLLQATADGELPNANVTLLGDLAVLTRVGALPGSDDWTHNYANASNSVVSKEMLVKAPLGLLWFGGPTHGGNSYNRILPRHGHGPNPQVVAGRLLIEGPNIIRAVDVYTGRVLWEANLPDVGKHYDYTSHEPGSNAIGSNYATAADGVYVCYGTECRRLNPKDGTTIGTFRITDAAYRGAIFSQVKIWDDLLVVAADPIPYDGTVGRDNYSEASSRFLVVMDRYSGTILWQRRANHSFHHNTIIVGNDILYCIDRTPPGEADAMSRRGVAPGDVSAPWELLALDVRTGTEIWSTTTNVFGTWLGYSEQYDVLLQSGRPSRDMVHGEPSRQIAYDGDSGTVLWERSSSIGGPCLLHGDMVIAQGSNRGNARHILTGETYMIEHPLTGALVPWGFWRTYGCNTAVGCENLLTFRSGAAGYYDMRNNSGTGNFGGFKSGCSSNLIPANGVLNAPDYTRTCTCGYQNQTSLAMVYMPEAEMWTHNSLSSASGPIKKVGINFGAPGDRLADNGVLWLDYPSVGGPSPRIDITTTPANPRWFRHHAAWFEGEDFGWVTASGAIGLTRVTIALNNTEQAEYGVRLYFAEPEGAEVGQRVFDVAIQGQQVASALDIAREAGSDGGGIIREFLPIKAKENLTVTLTASIGQPVICGIEVLVLKETRL